MDLTLDQLRVFLEVARSGSITRTAESLHLTQPAVSIRLKNLQNRFEIPLTETINRRIFLTEFGKELAKKAGTILDDVEALDEKAQAFRGRLTGRLRISCVSTGIYVLPRFLTDFLQPNPGVNLSLDVSNKASVVETLERNETDFALVSVLPTGMNLKRVTLMTNLLHLACSAHQRDIPDRHDVRKLETLPLIFREQGSATRLAMEKFIGRKKLHIGKKLELTSNEAVKQALIAGLGYSVMPLIGLRNELQQGSVRIVPMDGLPLKTSWELIWRADKRLSPVAQAFVSHLKRSKSSIIEQHFKGYMAFGPISHASSPTPENDPV
jgi:DNA-binding transcriptional LysR family regulator